MKREYILVMIVLTFLLAASALSGCLTTASNGTGTATPKPAGISTPAQTTAVKTLFDYDKVKSYKVERKAYRTAGQLMSGATATVTYTLETYNGVAARHVVEKRDSYVILPAGGYSNTSADFDYFYDLATKKLLAAHIVEKSSGGTKELNLEPTNNDALYYIQTFSEDMSFHMEDSKDPSYKNATNAGTDTVTVPMGTFTCQKYETSGKTIQGKYWMAGGYALPVKIEMVGSATRQTIELVEYQAA